MKKNLPDLEAEFDTAQNYPLIFEQLSPGRRNPVIWTCVKCGHSWPARVNNRLKGTECPRCQGTIPVPGKTDLVTMFPRIANEWDYEKNKRGPDEYLPYSNQPVYWICEAGHHWVEKINNRTANGLDCPYCSGSRPIPGVNDLGTLFPWIAEQWNYKKNRDLKPSDVFPKSNKRVSWICKRGHEWETEIYHRTEGRDCPYCSGQKPIVGETDLETLEPDISGQWLAEKNDGRIPSEFTRFSHYMAWWRCDWGHEYRSPIYRRSRGCGCPVCDGKYVIPGVNDLATCAPALASEWNYEQNKGITPEQVALHSNSKYSWICLECGHSWRATPNNRAAGRGCPKCAGRCVDSQVNSFATINPQLADQWDIQQNEPLTAWDVSAYDNRNYYWICSNGHSWKASPANRSKGTACPYCRGKLPVAGVNDFATICPDAAKEWHPLKNGTFLPADFLPNSHEKVWWRCKEGHEWQQLIYERANGSRCPYCSGKLPVSGVNDFATICPDAAKEWHPLKNGTVLPVNFLPNSREKVWWRCKEGHEWQQSINERANGSRCPYCRGKLPVAGVNDFATICPDAAKEWHPLKNGTSLPADFLPNSHEKVWWRCKEGHEWQQSINERANGRECPFCSRRKATPGENDLATLCPELSKHWSPDKNKKGPEEYFPDSAVRVWWTCEAGHRFRAPIREMVLRWRCPQCDRKRTAHK